MPLWLIAHIRPHPPLDERGGGGGSEIEPDDDGVLRDMCTWWIRYIGQMSETAVEINDGTNRTTIVGVANVHHRLNAADLLPAMLE